MRRKAIAILLALALTASAGCGQEDGPKVEPGDPPMSMEEHRELLNGPGTEEQIVEAVCQDMHNRGSFDDGIVAPEEVGC